MAALKWLSLMGTAHTQDYIFVSNRLKENFGASKLVEAALEDWRVRVPEAKLLFVGGGNAAVLFEKERDAVDAVRQWSREWLERAPALRLTAAHVEMTGEFEDPRAAYLEAKRRMAVYEATPPQGCDPGALPVVAACASTRLAASGRESATDSLLSEEALRKRRFADDQRNKPTYKLFRKYEERVLGKDYLFPKEIDDLGFLEGASQISIIHADGNGIGNRFAKLQGTLNFFEEIKKLSEGITEAAAEACVLPLERLKDRVPELQKHPILRGPREERRVAWPLPIIPLVDSGDDATWLCVGRLGLATAVHYLRDFEAQTEMRLGERLSACAGICVMPHGAPFAAGYQRASKLCERAKRARKDDGREGSWLDFVIILEGDERKPEGSAGGPYCVSRDTSASPQWEELEDLWRTFSRWPRSRAKQLYQVLSSSRKDDFEELRGVFASQGWPVPHGKRAHLRDALEFLDFHLDLPYPKTEAANA